MTAARRIEDLIARDLSRKIEEIIKVDQVDEQAVYTEITEYVATDRLREHYRTVLNAIAEAPAQPHEGTGVWISGFFGSGKSSFAKNLGYVIADRTVLGQRAAELLKAQLQDPLCASLIDSITARIPTEVVMFDVQVDRASGGTGTVSISHYMYRSLLRALDFAEDFDIAALEQSLEADGRLDDFVARFEARFKGEWRKRRKMAQKMNEASAVLHEMDRATYPQADSWAKAQAGKRVEVTPGFLVEKTFELMAQRRPGRTATFIIDEVGAYVARSVERIEDLRAVVEQFGKTSRNLVKARKVVAPVWVVVTSQEKLDEVVAALDSKRVELAKLQDRFRYRIDLAPADIREVATRRVLAKTPEAPRVLGELFQRSEGQLNTHLKLERTARRTDLARPEFVDFYPYPPHFLDLSIDIMSGIRLQPGAPRHLGGSNRTIIKQAFEMLVSERTGLARAEVGRLVTLDLVFDLVEGNLSSERQKDVSDIASQFGVGTWEVRVAKAITLLEFVRDVPRTEANLAAVLYDRVGAPSPLPQVTAALERLQAAKFVRYTEDGYKLQTQSEKSWETERRALDPKPRDRAERLREALRDVFTEPALRTFAYRNLKTFKVGLAVDEVKLEDGEIPLRVVTADSTEELPATLTNVQARSRQDQHQTDVFWAFALTSEIDELVADLFRSRQMVSKYDQLRAQGKISAEEASCLANEKHEAVRLQGRLRERLGQALQGGTSFFRGVSRDGSALGKSLTEIVRRLFELVVPDLYAKLGLGARPLKGTEAEEVLKAANLSGLPQVFYEGEQGLGLVAKDGSKYIPNPAAPVAKEILDFIQRRAAYGEKVSGKDLEQQFSGIGYGWDRDLIRLVLAVLLRAGVIEVTHQGRRFRGHQDVLCRVPFTSTTAFRAASFAPRESVGLKTLTTAAERFEALTGQEVDVEEAAIAQALKKLAGQEHADLLPALATVRAQKLPVEAPLVEYETTLRAILDGATDDCVRILADEGRSLKEAMARVRKIRDALADPRMAALAIARRGVEEMWPVLGARGMAPELASLVDEARRLIESPTFYESLPVLAELADRIDRAYRDVYAPRHDERTDVMTQQIEWLRGRAEWTAVPADMQAPLLAPLSTRTCEGLARAPGAMACDRCRASLAQFESDVAAAPALRAQILAVMQDLLRPVERVERVRLADFAVEPLDTEEAVRHFLAAVEAHLMKLSSEGVRIVIE